MKKFLLTLLTLFVFFPSWGDSVITVDQIRYSINENGTATCTGYIGSLKNLVILNKVSYNGADYPVTSISDYAFYKCSGITGTLTIGENVETIGESAFEGCSGFRGSLTIPESVTSIGQFAFCDCSGFTDALTIPESVTSIGPYAFAYCSCFTGSLTIPDSVTSIGWDAFSGCSGFTGSLTIGNSVTSIPDYAFSGCSGFTGSLNIPNSVTSIGYYAFKGCSGFTGSLTIGNAVTSIGGGAFYECTGFTGSLTIGDAVTYIGNSAFYNCSGFTGSLTIGDAVTSIGRAAFRGCSGFTAIELGESLEKIGDSSGETFYGCTKIESVTCHAANPPYFYGSDNFVISVFYKATLYVPAGSMDLYADAPVWWDFLNLKPIENSEGSVGTTIADSATEIQVIVEGHNVTILGVADNELVEVYDMGGNTVLTTSNKQFDIEASGIFIIKTADKAFKILVR